MGLYDRDYMRYRGEEDGDRRLRFKTETPSERVPRRQTTRTNASLGSRITTLVSSSEALTFSGCMRRLIQPRPSRTPRRTGCRKGPEPDRGVQTRSNRYEQAGIWDGWAINRWWKDQIPLHQLRTTWVLCFAVLAVSGTWSLAIRGPLYWGHAFWMASHFCLDQFTLETGRPYILLTHCLFHPYFWSGLVTVVGLFVFAATAEARTGPLQVLGIFLAATLIGALAHLFLLSETLLQWVSVTGQTTHEQAMQSNPDVVSRYLMGLIQTTHSSSQLSGPAAGVSALMVLAVASRPARLRARDDFMLALLVGLFLGLSWTGLQPFEGQQTSLVVRLSGVMVALVYVAGRWAWKRMPDA